ncbi:SRPBCC domain-containing protein [Frankia sp. AgB1.9]|uniref:SRPBCC family protein n=1 Tax=unclassified Frankia TaxID=2632575 RepID=UPI00193293B4|nr:MULTISPECIES: SRPBCC domain-containing protein [unclassified Frankia]MBL7487203.1 SRPBCC domain-containing protein [Frankia sp. AgW1.1]MBL7547948.1 SRPBCC domain-containing protein [Frankia sp. AgB1.9]MBL7623928.1 SRPBCC domain-containing protein [Frankia sp. AgB1.8]
MPNEPTSNLPTPGGREFAIERETELRTTPEDYWEAVTNGNAAWLWPMEAPEPRVGGAAAFGGTVLAWEPPHHLIMRSEGPEGWFNQLEHLIEARDGGTTWVRYVHSGVFVDDWDNQYDGAGKHTDFYLHTLGQYLRCYNGRPAKYVSIDAPASSVTPDGFDALRRAAGLADAKVGDRVQLTIPGLPALDAAVDYLTPHFLGLHTEDAMYRVFGRNAFGAPVAVAVHLFSPGADEPTVDKALHAWLDGVYA